MALRRGNAVARSVVHAGAATRNICDAYRSRGIASVHPTLKACLLQRQHIRQPFPHDGIQAGVRCASSASALLKTQLYDLHVSKGGKMVGFGGFSMPVTYSDMTITESSLWTRENASLFDVSHMLQHELIGSGAADFLSTITPSDPRSLKPMHSGLSAILWPSGGIVDDCIITSLGTRDGQSVFYMVTNAGNRGKDVKYITEQLDVWKRANPDKSVQWNQLDDKGLIAIQGPKSAAILEGIGGYSEDGVKFEFKNLSFGQCAYIRFGSMASKCLVSRGGYTGEDGFEISIPSAGRLGENKTRKLTELLLEDERLRLAGLGARDTLRLEAGMCLYGHDIDDSTTPVEGALGWIIPKTRRETGGFLGAEKILPQLKPKKDGGSPPAKRRVGLIVNDKAPAREGSKIVDESGEEIGRITSGGPSPTLGKNVAMGYIKNGLHKSGTEVGVVVRNKTRPATVTKMPFVPSKYFKPALSPS